VVAGIPLQGIDNLFRLPESRAGQLTEQLDRYGARHSVAVWGVITMYAARDWP